MSKSYLIGVVRWLDPAELSLDRYINSSRDCVLGVDLGHKLHNKYPLAAHKSEIKKEMSDYQLFMIIIFLLVMLEN